MRLTWFGLACFLVEGDECSVLMDPFDDTVGFAVPRARADIWTCSHDHYDHNHRASVTNADVVDAVDGLVYKGARLRRVQSWHDGFGGALWGENSIWVVEMDGLRLAHLGDLGHLPAPGQLEALGAVDVLLVPTGGLFTIDEKMAAEVVQAINPRLALPMHYYAPGLRGFELNEGIELFLARLPHRRVVRQTGNVLNVTPALLAEPTVAVLELPRSAVVPAPGY